MPPNFVSLTNSDIQSQYEFLYRAVSDYVDLYKNKEEDYDYSVPVGAVTNNGTTKVENSVTHSSRFNVILTECLSSQPNQSSQPNH